VFVTQLAKLGIADTKNNVKIKTPVLSEPPRGKTSWHH